MLTRGLRRRVIALWSAIAAVLLFAVAVPPAASADTMRTLNVALSCSTGLPYGLSVNNGSGWYYPSGSSYAVGDTKYFTVSIPASANEIAIDTTYCDGEQSQYYGAVWNGGYSSLTPGTSTVNGYGNCSFNYIYPGIAVRICYLATITYS